MTGRSRPAGPLETIAGKPLGNSASKSPSIGKNVPLISLENLSLLLFWYRRYS